MWLFVTFLAAANGIYGGSVAQPGYLPFQVGIYIPLPFLPPPLNFVLCGGVILDSTHVLTAGHCAYDTANKFLFNATTANFRVGVFYNVTSPYFGVVQYLHPTYTSALPSAERVDLAVFKVSPPFVFNADVQPVTLAAGNLETVGRVLQVSGYGLTPAVVPSNSLLYVNMSVVDSAVCSATLQADGLGPLPVSTFCAGGVAGQSFCTGDSGGPFVYNTGTSAAPSWVLVGTVRGFGSATCGAANKYGLFSSINSQRSFIASAQNDTAKSGAPSAAALLAVSALMFLLAMLL